MATEKNYEITKKYSPIINGEIKPTKNNNTFIQNIYLTKVDRIT